MGHAQEEALERLTRMMAELKEEVSRYQEKAARLKANVDAAVKKSDVLLKGSKRDFLSRRHLPSDDQRA